MSTKAPPTGLVVVLVGATGAVGKDLCAALERSPVPVRELRLVATRRSSDQEISWGGSSLPVQPLGPRGAMEPVFRGADAVLLATPAELTRTLAPALAEQGICAVDIGGALLGHGASFVPGLGLDLARFDRTRMVSTPWAPVVALASTLAPLRSLGLQSARGTVMLSAGLYGRSGVEELSAQVVSLLGGGSPTRKVFPTGLAFDLSEPPDGGDGADGWSETELRLARETAGLLGLEASHLAFTAVLVPLFAGLAASLHLRFSVDPSPDDVVSALSGAEGVRVGDPVPSPRRLPGRSGVYVGRLRVDSAGDGIHLWLAADNLRFGATAPAIGALKTLFGDGRLQAS